MNTNPEDSTANNLPAWYEPFPEPRTIPGGWDLSEYCIVPPMTKNALNDLEVLFHHRHPHG